MTDDDSRYFSRRAVAQVVASAAMVTIYPSLEARSTRRRIKPIVIGHRGASADRPEHTLASYREAIAQGADYIEPDLVRTKDGVFVARHENEIGGTTDVAARAEFAARKTSKIIDGETYTGWFVEDFTLAELKTLRARERLPALRPQNTAYDGQFDIPTLAEIIQLAMQESARLKRTIGIYPETKHPTHHAQLGLPMEEALLQQLTTHGYRGARDPVFIQSFEVANLKKLAALTTIRLIQLIDDSGSPADAKDDPATPRRYADMITADGLKAVARYASGIGVAKALILPRTSDHRLAPATRLIPSAHAAGLQVHAWTFRPENQFLHADFAAGTDPAAHGDGTGEVVAFLAQGLDGIFADHPADAVAARHRMG